MRKKTHEEYVAELAIKNPNLEPIEEYVNANTSILHRCKTHNKEFKIFPRNALQGCGCNECRADKTKKRCVKTHDQYVKEVADVAPNYVVLGTYVNAKTKILHYCKKHNIEWMTTPDNILHGCGCPECGKEKAIDKRLKNHEQYVKELNMVNPYIIPLEKYIKGDVPILHLCLKDGYQWNISPDNALRGKGCPKCGKVARLTTKEYKERLNKVNPDIEVIGDYVNMRTPILHRCLLDGYEWFTSPINALASKGCPKCQETIGERVVRQCLEKNNIRYEYQKSFKHCKSKQCLPFDFYLPEYNIIIEYNGIQHYKAVKHFGGNEKFKIQRLHDQIKKDFCDDNYIQLIYIPYWEFNNTENIILNYLNLYKLN